MPYDDGELAKILAERDGYLNAYEKLNGEVGQLRAERDGYKAAYLVTAEKYGVLRMTAAPVDREIADPAALSGKPSVFVATLPKSGTIFVGHTLRQSLDYDFTSTLVSVTFPKNIVWGRMAMDFRRGGMVSVSHMQPDKDNLGVLYRAGIRKIVVHVRDPRAALLSWFHFFRKNLSEARNRSDALHFPAPQVFTTGSDRAQIDFLIGDFYTNCLNWIGGWLAVAEQDDRFDILFMQHEELTDTDAYFGRIFAFHGIRGATVKPLDQRDNKHFRTGDNDEWRAFFTPAQAQTVTAMISPELWRKFKWKS